MGRARNGVAAALLVGLGVLSPAAARADPATVLPYGTNDAGGFSSVIPPGQGTNTGALAAGAFLAAGVRPDHTDDQRLMYADLPYATPGLKAADIPRYFHDATFGVRPGDVAGRESPRADVTIVRDASFGIPHIYGSTRSGTMFGAGYVAGEDRLFFMDVLRHYGSAQLSSFAGGANRATDEQQFLAAPYSPADMQRMYDQLAVRYGAEGAQLQRDLQDYADGVNAFIADAHLNPNRMPAEYAALGHVAGPDPWKPTDSIAVGSLIGAQLGTGGGGELDQALLLSLAQRRFGASTGAQVTGDLRSANDPESPLSIRGARFPYDLAPAQPAPGSVALPDGGTAAPVPVATNPSGSAVRAASGRGVFGGLLHFPTSDSNALLVSARDSASGHPLMVAGSQAAYFNPEIYLEEDLHGPGIDARGAALPGASFYVVIGHGRDYAWSATSASQDVVDTYAVDLCNADGSAPGRDADHYLFHGQCLPMETVSHPIAWSPSLADSTPAGSETLSVQRTRYGLVIARGTVGGAPVAFTHLRTTYQHEIDSALGFYEFDNPDLIHSAQDFMHAANKIGYTFNWLYSDDRDIAMITTGAEPVRAPGVDGTLPVRARPEFEWRGWNADDNTTTYVPFEQRPQVVNQDMIFSWNTRQARDFASSEPRTPVWRSQLLEKRLRATRAAKGKLALTDVIDAMAGGGTADLRCEEVLPYLLQVLGRPADPALAAAVDKLAAWRAGGCQRSDRTQRGHYDHAAAIQIFDAWQHPLQQAIFAPVLGPALYDYFAHSLVSGEDTPNTYGDQLHARLGSSWEQGAFMFEQKDLRTILEDAAAPAPARVGARRPRHRRTRRGARARSAARQSSVRLRHRRGHRPHAALNGRVQGRYAVRFCGGGDLAACRRALESSLRAALAADPAQQYADPTVTPAQCGVMDRQMCFDAIRFRALGLITEPLMPWQNRPTQQQLVEVQSHRAR